MKRDFPLLAVTTALMLTAAAFAAPPRKKGSTPVNPAKPSAARGRSLFLTNCASCHGANGAGDDGPSLRRKHLSESFLTMAIQKGFKDEMPPFSPRLPALDIRSLTLYVRTWQK